MDYARQQLDYELFELDIRTDFKDLGKGIYRFIPRHNHLFGEDGWGIGLSFDQELGDGGLVAFFRLGIGDPDVTARSMSTSWGTEGRTEYGPHTAMRSSSALWP